MIFFPAVLAVYFVIPKKLRHIWLLIASYYFYMSWNAAYAALIGIVTVSTYAAGLLIGKSRSNGQKPKKTVVAFCTVIVLGILAFYKYGNFAISIADTIARLLFGTSVESRLNLILPVGISFYTFQAIGYVIDVYRGEMEAEKNFIRYALFVSFFPQLVAGPIERSKNLLKQMRHIEEIRLWNIKRITSGAILMVWGLFMKMVIADRAAIVVNTVFDSYRIYGSTELILGAAGFAVQIYCDFASYSTIAIGAARIMGFDLMENFRAPYLAKSIEDFWDRWHISLTKWFTDYLYIPLGGSRKGKIRKYINIMIVFLVSGLWHGADWSFVVWGGIHGIYRIMEECLKPAGSKIADKLKIRTECASWKLLRIAVTFVLVTFAWIFFRASSVAEAFDYIRRIVSRPTPWVLFDGGLLNIGLSGLELNILVIGLVMLFAVDMIRIRKNLKIDELLFSQNMYFEWGFIILLIVMIFVFGEYGYAFDAQQFIYFQF